MIRLGRIVSSAAMLLAVAMTLSACSEGEALTRETFFSALSDAQRAAGSSQMTMEVALDGQTFRAEGEMQIGESAEDSAISSTTRTGSASAGDLTMLMIGGTFYLNLGQATQDKFVKIEPSEEGTVLAAQFSQVLDQLDVSKQLDLMEGALKSLTVKSDSKKIDGVDAQPYELVLHSSKIDTDLLAGASAGVPDTITYVMYIGPDNLLRRMTFELAGSRSKVDYSKWGNPVDIKAPSADEISDQDISKLLSGAASG